MMADVPLDPDAREAAEWVLRELGLPEYEAAKPTWFDRAAAAVQDWFASLRFDGAGGPPVLGILLVLTVVIVVLVAAFLIFGMPRLRRRSALRSDLFGVDDQRSSEQLRAAAEAAAARGDYAKATAEMFRAIARSMSERVIVTTTPGTTAHDFALRTAAEFPDLAASLTAAAAAFDEVRYLGRPGSAAAYTAVATLETTLRRATPAQPVRPEAPEQPAKPVVPA